MSNPDKDLGSADSSSINTPTSESTPSNPEAGVESGSSETAASPANIENVSVDREAANQAPSLDDRSRAHEEELERLKERLREQDARLEATTRLLSAIRIPEPVAPGPAPTPPSRTPKIAVMGAAAALAIVAGFLYLRSQAAHPLAQNQSMALSQPQPAASTPSTTTQLAGQPPLPALQPPPVAATQPGRALSSSPQSPVAQAPATEAKAEPLPLPLPDSEQGPPPSVERPPDEAPPSAAAPVEKSALDDRLSANLTDYLHHHRLPFVDAMVYAKAGTPSSISLSGQVRTALGKKDAETKSRDW